VPVHAKTETHITHMIRVVSVNRRESKATIEYEGEGGHIATQDVKIGEPIYIHQKCSFSQGTDPDG
jgi:hypothetical protein